MFAAGDRVLTLGADGTMIIWDVMSGEALQRLTTRGARRLGIIRVLGHSRLATVAHSETDLAVIWDLASGSPRHELLQRRGRIRILEASPGGSHVVTAGWGFGSDASVCLWDVATGQLQQEWQQPRGRGEAMVSDGGARVVVQHPSNHLAGGTYFFVWDGMGGELRRRLTLDSGCHLAGKLVAMLPGGRHVAAINRTGAAIWDVEAGEQVLALDSRSLSLGHLQNFRIAVFSCGRVVAACSRHVDKNELASDIVDSLAMWHVGSGRMLSRMERRVHASPPPDSLSVSSCDIRVAHLATMADELLGKAIA